MSASYFSVWQAEKELISDIAGGQGQAKNLTARQKALDEQLQRQGELMYAVDFSLQVGTISFTTGYQPLALPWVNSSRHPRMHDVWPESGSRKSCSWTFPSGWLVGIYQQWVCGLLVLYCRRWSTGLHAQVVTAAMTRRAP